MSIAVIGVTAPGAAATALQTPSRSKISLAPCDSASERSPRPTVPSARESRATTSRSASASANARVAPTGPAPMMTTSCSIERLATGRSTAAPAPTRPSSGARRLYIAQGFRRRGGQVLVAMCRDQHVVLDPHANIPELLGHVICGPDVATGLDGEHHSGLERSRLAVDAVQPDVVDIKTEPVTRPMHIELLVRARFEHGIERPFAQLEIDQALSEHALGHLVIVVKRLAGSHRIDACELCGEDQLVDRFLSAVEGAPDRKRAGDVGGVALELAPGIDQQQSACLHLPVVLAIVQDAGVGTGGDDRRISDCLRAEAQELVREL